MAGACGLTESETSSAMYLDGSLIVLSDRLGGVWGMAWVAAGQETGRDDDDQEQSG